MPPETYWKTFFNPSWILKTLGPHEAKRAIVDVGAGYGTFALAAAGLTRQQVIAIDIGQPLLDALTRRAKADGLDNEKPMLRDAMMDGTGLPWMGIRISCCSLIVTIQPITRIAPFPVIIAFYVENSNRRFLNQTAMRWNRKHEIWQHRINHGLAETRSPTSKTCCLRFLIKSAVRCPEFAYQTADAQKYCNCNSLILPESVII
jgi:SAM-dependent methyltransferase